MKNLSPSKSGFLNQLYSSRQSSYHGSKPFETVSSTLYYDILYEHKYKRKLQCYKMSVCKKNYKSFLEVHQWRCKTSLPIVKSYYIDVIDDHTQLVCLQSFHEHIPQRLQSLFNIPLVQALYLLKESLIGLERLFEKFGGFYLTNKMIGINQNNKCKVWLNQSFNENKFNPANIQENQFCLRVLSIFRNHLMDSDHVEKLWIKLLEKPTFISIMKTIEQFAQQNLKIYKTPSKFQLNSEEKPTDLSSTIPDTNLIYSKTSVNSLNTTDKAKSSFRSQHQVKKIQRQSSNKLNIDKTLSLRENYSRPNFSIFTIKIKTQQETNDILSPQDTIVSSPEAQDTFNSNLQHQHKRKVGNLYRSSEIDFAFFKSEFQQIPQRQRKYSSNELSKGAFTCKTSNHKANTNSEDNEESLDINPLLMKHGWEKKVDNLMSLGNVKESIIQGSDVPISDSMIRCQKLDIFTNQIVKSLLPCDLQVIPDDIYL